LAQGLRLGSAMAGRDKIQLLSKEGDLFDISSDAARLSNFVATMQDDGLGDESIPLPNVTKRTLTKVVRYMEYHVANPPAEIYRPIRRGNLAYSNVCEWDCDFLEVEQDVLFELILAADYLDIQPLLDLACAKVLATQPPIFNLRFVDALTMALITQMSALINDREDLAIATYSRVGGLRVYSRSDHERIAQCVWAANTLGNLGEHAAPAVPALIECLEDRDPDVRKSAVGALGNLGEHAAPAGPALINCLEDSSDFVRSSAADALGNLGEHAAPAVPALIKCAEHREGSVRRSAAAALGKIGEKAAKAVPARLRDFAKAVPARLQHREDFVRCSAADALSNLGEHAAPAVPALATCAEDDCQGRDVAGREGRGRREVRSLHADVLAKLGCVQGLRARVAAARNFDCAVLCQ